MYRRHLLSQSKIEAIFFGDCNQDWARSAPQASPSRHPYLYIPGKTLLFHDKAPLCYGLQPGRWALFQISGSKSEPISNMPEFSISGGGDGSGIRYTSRSGSGTQYPDLPGPSFNIDHGPLLNMNGVSGGGTRGRVCLSGEMKMLVSVVTIHQELWVVGLCLHKTLYHKRVGCDEFLAFFIFECFYGQQV